MSLDVDSLMPQESSQEFAARMDRARRKSAAESNRVAFYGILVYALIGVAYFGMQDRDVPWLIVFLIVLDSIVLLVAVRSMISMYKSRRF